MDFLVNMYQTQRRKQTSMDYKLDKQFNMSGFVKMEINVDSIVNGMSFIDVDYMLVESNP